MIVFVQTSSILSASNILFMILFLSYAVFTIAAKLTNYVILRCGF